jgi:quinol-cytochrome oxidoreductase complex cytochrome b subunit/coenzyme F420-reducing hydrogenase delta subunit/Pyruvate/2-oxoacid:ferredoxin oxidoreductase delta subunit
VSVPTDNDTVATSDGVRRLVVMDGAAGSDDAARPEPGVPTGLLRWLEKGFLRFDRLIGRVLPEPLNPFLHTGAIAVVTLLVATVTGIILLLWYRPSVHLAHQSVQAMSDAPFTAGLIRSLHRYSSDACMFFALVHALRYFLARRFVGTQWLAWVTGIVMVGILWFVGWTGYWLVWDLRAQEVAVATSRLVDVLPVFTDPLERSFVTDEGVNSLLFFVIFFFHMLVPLAMGVVMWLHITRLARARFLTRGWLTVWVLGSLLLLSIAYPATNLEPARMAALTQPFTMDWWYMLPLAFTDRLAAGILWTALLVAGAVTFSVPWWLGGRRPETASVIAPRCNACTKCFQDCPYEAISMIPRTDGSTHYDIQAHVNPDKCVGCGICAGSCDTAGVGLSWFAAIDQRRRLEAWIKDAVEGSGAPHVAFVCAESAGACLDVDPVTGICEELPGYRVARVPCAGWVHPLLIERAVRHGAEGVLVVTCEPGECQYREGAEWTRQRLAGEREPVLRTDKVPLEQVRMLSLARTRGRELVSSARSFRDGQLQTQASLRAPALTGLAAALLALIVAGLVGLVSDLGYAAPPVAGSELVVSFSHPGRVSEDCRALTPEEQAERPIHMRQAEVCERRRAPVRLAVALDGTPIVETSFPPGGIWGDGNSVAIERIPIEPGEHRVRVSIGESTDPEEWGFSDERMLEFDTEVRRTVVFDRVAGFGWH